MTDPKYNDLTVPDNIADRSVTDSRYPLIPSRRRLLQTLTGGSLLLLAGCGENESNIPTATGGGQSKQTNGEATNDLPMVRGQTLRTVTSSNPAKTSFHGGTVLNVSAFASRVMEEPSHDLQRIIWEPGVRAEGFGSGKTHYAWIEEPIEITPTEVTITIRESAKWSDGHQITAKDIACVPLQELIARYNPPYFSDVGPDEPANINAAFDGFEITDKTVTYMSSAGHFDGFWNHTIINELGTYIGPRILPTHIEPYATYADAVIETARRAVAGNINPWEGYGNPKQEPDDPHKEVLVEKYVDKVKYVDKFGKPENVVATGAWNLIEMEGKEFVFEPNQYHRNGNSINFSTLRFEYTPSADRERAALNADRLDFSGAHGGPPTPQAVVESIPDNFKQLLVPGIQFSGNELALNFHHPALGNRAVRVALMYALDQKTIASNIHPSAAPPVVTPGGDCWDATDYVSQAWIDENLTMYTTNREKAARHMREAGYTREDGQWIGAGGEPFTLTLTTPNPTPRWEPTVASQLTQFGINTSVQTLEGNVYRNRVDQGKFSIWPSTLSIATNLARYLLRFWKFAAINPERLGVFPEEQYQTGHFNQSGTPIPKTEERYSVFTIKAPPIGQAEGPLKAYHPAALALLFRTNPPEAEFRRRIKIGMWLANWFLPTIPLTKKLEQYFIDDAHWMWPTDTPFWKSLTDGESVLPGGLFAKGAVQANPDNPEEGATVGKK